MAIDSVPRLRLTPIPDRAQLVVRGDALDPGTLRADARRFHRRFADWQRFGVSALLATDDIEVEALCETRLKVFATIVVFRRPALEQAGVEVVPTFRRPHVTLAHPELEALVSALRTCEHGERENPHHHRDGEG
jgi:hypothetical protein